MNDIGVDVSSKESRAQSVAYCTEMVKQGNSVVIYPEGLFFCVFLVDFLVRLLTQSGLLVNVRLAIW